MISFIEILIILLLLSFFVIAVYFSWKKFWFLISINIFILILFAAVGGISGYKPCFSAFFVIMFPCGAFFVLFNFAAIFRFWEERSVLALLPLFVSLLGFWLVFFSIDIGKGIRIKVFKDNLYLYQQAVEELTPMIGEKGLYLDGDQIPQKYRKLSYVISAEKSERIVFDFIWDFGFPLKHSAFTYCSDGSPPSWPFRERINEHWFRVGD